MKKSTMGLIIALVATLVIAAIIGVSSGGFDMSAAVLKVNGEKITKKMVEDTLKQTPASSSDIKNPQGNFMYLIYKNKVVNDLIIKELLDQEAKKTKTTVSDKEVENKITDLTNRMGGKEKFEQSLASNRLTPASFREMIQFELLKEKMADNISKVNVGTEKAAKEFYEKNKNQYFKHPAQVRAAHILINASEMEIRAKIESAAGDKKLTPAEVNSKVHAEMEKIKAEATKVLTEVKANPAKFSEIASTKSQDTTSAARGGDLGFFSAKEMVPEFSKTAFSLKPGQISGLVKTEFGYHIIKATDRKKAGLTPFDEVKVPIQNFLKQKGQQETIQKLVEGLRNTAKIEYLDKEYDPKQIETKIREINSKPSPTAPMPPVDQKPAAKPEKKK